MAFGANSKMFVTWPLAVMGAAQSVTPFIPAGPFTGLGSGSAGDVIKAALYNNTGTPNEQDSPASRNAYNGSGGQWVTANEVIDSVGPGTNWPAGGVTLASKTQGVSANVYTFDAADAVGGGNVTISNAYGCLVYDNTITAGTGGVAKLGICFNSFGGAQSVTAGVFTIVWNAAGIFTITV